jgi:hypothetical protein
MDPHAAVAAGLVTYWFVDPERAIAGGASKQP